jgi:hypothetical protein
MWAVWKVQTTSLYCMSGWIHQLPSNETSMSTARSSQLWLMQGKVLSPMCGKEHKFQALLGFRVGWMIGFWKVFCLALHCSTASYWQTTSCLLSDIETLNTIITKPSVRIKFVSWGQIFVAHKSLHVYLFCWSIENLRSSGGNDQPRLRQVENLFRRKRHALMTHFSCSNEGLCIAHCACIFGRELDYLCH